MAIFTVHPHNHGDMASDFAQWSAEIKKELLTVEPNLSIALQEVEVPGFVVSENDGYQLLKAIYAAHNGVYAMSTSIPDLVEDIKQYC